jgi:hypothetical protein
MTGVEVASPYSHGYRRPHDRLDVHAAGQIRRPKLADQPIEPFKIDR